MPKFIIAISIYILYSSFASSQNGIRGSVSDTQTQESVSGANIIVGGFILTVTDQQGTFHIEEGLINNSDSIQVTALGFFPETYHLVEGDSIANIQMKQNPIELKEIIVYSLPEDPEDLVRLIVRHKGENYPQDNFQEDVLSKYRGESKDVIARLKIKENSFSNLDAEELQDFSEAIPKSHFYAKDELYRVYSYENERKVVRKKSVKTSVDEADQAKKIADRVIKKAKGGIEEGKVWKLNSGIFSRRVDIGMDDENKQKATDFAQKEKYKTLVDACNKYIWWKDFFLKPRKYHYKYADPVNHNGEQLTVIEFSRNKSEGFIGKLYVHPENYALIKVEYRLAPKGAYGVDVLDIIHQTKQYSVQAEFRQDGTFYKPHYLRFDRETYSSVDRPFSLLMKKDGWWIFNKTEAKIKTELSTSFTYRERREFSSIESRKITKQEFSVVSPSLEIKEDIVPEIKDARKWHSFSNLED